MDNLQVRDDLGVFLLGMGIAEGVNGIAVLLYNTGLLGFCIGTYLYFFFCSKIMF